MIPGVNLCIIVWNSFFDKTPRFVSSKIRKIRSTSSGETSLFIILQQKQQKIYIWNQETLDKLIQVLFIIEKWKRV